MAEIIVSSDSELVFVPNLFASEDAYVYAIFNKDDTDLLSRVNTVIDSVVEGGLYETWIEEAKILAKQLGK